MYIAKTMIANPSGLHARPATEFVAEAKKFKSKIEIRHATEDSESVNGKSVIMLLTLGIGQGEEVEIMADGIDGKEAVDALVSLIKSGFGEL